MSALAPFMLFGLLLASAPIIIHLLNRRRFIRVDWAPMEYLKLTLKANRRRLRLEQILLLIVRTLIVVLLFLALTRFVAQRDSLAGLLTSRARTSRVVVIDDTLSMGHLSGGSSSLDRAKEAAGRVIKMTGPKDSLTVMSVSQPDAPLLRQAQLQENDDLVHVIQALKPSHLANNWKQTFDRVGQHLESALFPIKEVIVLTDLKAEGWTGELVEITERWAKEDVKVFLVDVGAEARGNVVLESFIKSGPKALVGDKILFIANVRNDGAELLSAPQATLTVDGASRTLNLPDLPSGEQVEVPVSLSFDSSGEHVVELSLPTDLLPGDNTRYAVIDVRDSLEVVLVDGEPGRAPFEGETDFLALALSVGRSPWQISQLTDAEWLNSPMTAPDVLVLANVSAIESERVKEVEEMVKSGMGVMIFPGEQLDPTAWNEQMYRAGQGLLPASIGAVLDQEVKGLAIEPAGETLLGQLSRLSAASMAGIQPRRLAMINPLGEADTAVRVLARWNDAQNSPALLEKTLERGRVLLWTVTADRGWSDWPREPSFVLAMRQSIEMLTGGGDEKNNLTAGQTLRVAINERSTAGTIQGPELTEAVPVNLEGVMELEFEETRFAGVYEAGWKDAVTGERKRLVAVSPDERESRLQPLSPERLGNLMGQVQWEIVPFNGESGVLAAQGAELWRSLIFGMMALIAAESLLAAWVGRPK